MLARDVPSGTHGLGTRQLHARVPRGGMRYAVGSGLSPTPGGAAGKKYEGESAFPLSQQVIGLRDAFIT